MEKSHLDIRSEASRKLAEISHKHMSATYEEKRKVVMQLQEQDPEVSLICGFYSDKAKRLFEEKPKTGDASDFAFMYLFAEPPGVVTDAVDAVEEYLKTGNLPKEVIDARTAGLPAIAKSRRR